MTKFEQKSALYEIVAFKKCPNLSLCLYRRKLEEMGQKLDFRAFCSEIYMKIELFSSLEHHFTSAPIAQLAARLTFFIWIRPEWPDQSGRGFNSPLRNMIFFLRMILFLSIIYEYS